MRVLNVTLETLEAVAKSVGVTLYEVRPTNTKGTGWQFTLRPNGSRYYRRGRNNRRVWAVCWHGHRDFFRALFDLAPDAKVRTTVARYDGREGFEKTYPSTGDRNIGSIFEPLPLRYACDC